MVATTINKLARNNAPATKIMKEAGSQITK